MPPLTHLSLLHTVFLQEPQILPLFIGVQVACLVVGSYRHLFWGYKGSEFYQENVSFSYK